MTLQARTKHTERLIAFLEVHLQDALIVYQDLAGAAGLDVRHGKGYGYLQTARRHLRREKRIVFEVVRGEGLKRATDSDLANNEGPYRRKRIRGQCREGIKNLLCADFEKLTNEEKQKLTMERSALGSVNLFSKQKEPIPMPMLEDNRADRMAKLLELFRI